MQLSKEQITTLLELVASVEPDDLDCDGCLSHLAEFAEVELERREIPDALKAVERHLEQCLCCKDEYNTLLDGLRALEDA